MKIFEDLDLTPFETPYFGQRYYVEPYMVIKHHFTGEPIIQIRMETVNGLGHGMCEYKFINKKQLDNLRDTSLVEEDD